MDDPRQAARDLLRMHAVTLERLWISYWAQGGDATDFEFEAYVHEALQPTSFDLKVLAWAIEDLQRRLPNL